MADDGSVLPDELVFVGTGHSAAIPSIGHLNDTCEVCMDSMKPNSRNRRNNVSILIRVGATNSNIMIDCGKTFRDAFLDVLAPRKVSSLSSLLLTHQHADALQGVDDLRDLQQFQFSIDHKTRCLTPTPTYLSQYTLDSLKRQYSYITNASDKVTKDPNVLLDRKVTCLSLHVLSDQKVEQFTPPGSEKFGGFVSIPVEHGKGYQCLGFVFGTQTRVVYLSDVSFIGEQTLTFLRSLPFISILIIDCLYGEGKTHFSHFCIDQVWDLVIDLKPKRTFCVGIHCTLDHTKTNSLLASRLDSLGDSKGGIESVELAYDGLELPVSL